MTDAEINDLLTLPGGEIDLIATGTSSGFDPSHIKASWSGYTVADVRYSTTQRFKLAPLMAAAPKLQAALGQVWAENERLREALEMFSSYENWRQGGPFDPNSPSFVGIGFASAALNGGADD